MNRDILILREAITKVVQMLAGMGLRVTQRGSSAYVQTNPKTLKPEVVNIPFIPDNATDELIHAIQGFMDHEVAHILFTDWTAVVAAQKLPKLDSLHNIVEDPFIEREMGKKFPGAAHNIHVLHDFFIRKITQPALDEVDAAHRAGKLKGQDYELARFSVLLVPLVRAWSGQFTFDDFMSKNGHYTSNKFISLLIAKTPQATLDRIPRIKTSWEALDVAKELHAILYPPKSAQQPNQPGQGEECKDGESGKPTKDNKSNKKDTPGKGEKEHKNDSKNADGDEESNENPEDANNEAGEGEGEAGSNKGGTTKSSKGEKSTKNKEKKDDAEQADDEAQDDDPGSDSAREDGDGASGDDRDERGADRDASGGDQGEEEDQSEDDAGGGREGDVGPDDGSSDPDDEGTDDGSDDSDESEAGANDGDGDDEDEQDGNGDSSGRGSDHDDRASKAEEGEDSDEDEGEGAGGKESGDEEGGEDGKGASELSDGEADQDIDIDDANNHSKSDGGDDMKTSGQPGIGHVDGDFEDVDVKPYSFEAMVRQHITDEAARQTRDADYAIYSNEFDIFAKHEMTPSFKSAQFTGLEDTTRGMVGVMQKEIERMMAQRNRVFNVGGQKSGKLNAPGFSRILVNDPRVFKKKQEHQAKDTAVSLLVDNSGSMSGQRILTAMTAAYALSSTLDRVSIQHECLGFTTAYQGKPGSGYDYNQIDNEARRLGVEYSRIVPLRITVFKDFTERLTPPVRHRFADMAYNQPHMMSNIDGEAVQIALNRLQARKEQRKVLLVLSDGMPAGGVPADLYSHLHKVVADADKMKIEVIGIGIQTNAVKSFYPKNVVLNDVAELPKLVMGELKKILLAA